MYCKREHNKRYRGRYGGRKTGNRKDPEPYSPEVIRDARKRSRDWQNARERERKRTDPKFAMISRLRKRVRFAITRGKSKKMESTKEILGCSLSLFKRWIENQFMDGMTWNNMSEWALDHVKPCTSFDMNDKEQVRECFNWRNTRPLWHFDNISKGNRIYPKLIAEQEKKADNFEKKYNKLLNTKQSQKVQRLQRSAQSQ
jgi:hypothetical protein